MCVFVCVCVGGGGQDILLVVSRGVNVFTFSLEGSGKIWVMNQDLSRPPNT